MTDTDTTTDQPEPMKLTRWVDYMPLPDVYSCRDPANVKRHADAVIADGLGRFGIVELIVLDERTGRLVAGHGRVEQLQALHAADADNPPEGIAEADGIWMVPVVRGWHSANDDEARAAMVTLNRATEVGGWDTAELTELLAELGTTDPGLPPGFTADDLDNLLAELGAGELDPQPTDAAHADDLSRRGEPAPPRQVQGLHEVGLIFTADQRAEYDGLLAQLRRRWVNPQMPAPQVVLRALRQALHYDGTEDG